MLTVLGAPWGKRSPALSHGLSRRAWLQIGGAGLLGTNLANVWGAEAAGLAKPAPAKSVIFVFLYGGPSQLETFDMKPNAPTTVRGPFRPIGGKNPELRICEHLPRLAERSDKYAVVRTVNHPQNDHNGTHFIQTGRPLPPADRGAAQVNATEKDWPAYGSAIAYLDERRLGASPAFPPYVYLPRLLGHFAGYDINGMYAGWLGKPYNPVATRIEKRDAGDNPYFRDCTDAELDFRVGGLEPTPELVVDRLDQRRSLLGQLEVARRELGESRAARR